MWTLRFNRDTGYRGGDAKNMKEEFAVYGLPEPVMYAVGATKVALASAMLVGTVVPRVTRPASIGLAADIGLAVGRLSPAGPECVAHQILKNMFRCWTGLIGPA